jgi:alpha-tubulin suppressor-like RCC1 family protein
MLMLFSAATSRADDVTITAVAAGDDHSLYMKSDGSLWAIGYNGYGQLGDGTNTNRNTPVQVDTDVKAVAAGYNHSLYVKSDGSLWAVGYNYYGQLGNGTNTSRSTPVQVDTDVKAVAAGGDYSLYVKSDGSLWAMGYNYYGQLGDGTNTNRNTPVQVDTDVKTVAAGYNHSLYMKNDGSLWAMGYNGGGQLGDATNTNRNTPVEVDIDVKAVAAGYNHSLYIKNDGSFWAMGYNYYGQLGNGTNMSRNTPVQVDTDIKAVAASYNHSLYVKSDGSLWVMGDNTYGQLGDGTNTNRNTPVQIDADVKVVAAGVSHNLYIKNDGSLWAMGYNYYGQLGNGANTNRNTPVLVPITPAVPTITTSPANQIVTASQNASFTIAASGNPAPTYQWQSSTDDTTWANLSNTSPYSGVTSATLTITGASASLNGRQYRCVVTNSQGNTTSDAATLTVNPNPVITTQPVSQTVNAGQRTTFTVAAIGAPTISYQWQILGTDGLWASLVNNTTYSSATTATLTASNVTRDMSGAQYRCYVSNYAGNATSGTATLTVATTPVVTTQPVSRTVPLGQNTTFTLVATGTPAPTYQWQILATDNLWAPLSNNTTYSGVTTTRLTVASVTADMSGAQYRCILSNMAGSITSNAATLTLATDAVIAAAQNLRNQLQASGAATITVTGAINLSLVGGATVTSGKTIVGADASSTITGGLIIAAGASNTIILGVNFTTGTLAINGANDVTVTHCTFTDTPVSITGSYNIAFSWNKFTATPAGTGSAMIIANAVTSLHHNLWDAGLKSNMPAATNARVFMFNNYITATGNTTATIAGNGAQILSANNIYQGTHNPLTTQSTGLLHALGNFTTATTGTTNPGDDTVFVPAYSQIMDSAGIDAPSAATLATRITTYAGNTGGKNSSTPAASVANATAKITATVTGAGSTTAATGASVPAGGSFTLTANATNFTPTSRQWYLDNFPLPGATANTHTVTNAIAATDAGTYSVALRTPASETVTSAAFTVSVTAGGGGGNTGGGSSGGGNSSGSSGGGGGGAPSLLWLGAVGVLLVLRFILLFGGCISSTPRTRNTYESK